MEITNKFDNVFTGVAGDGGSTGTLTNSGNFYATGEFWDLETCEDPENTDHTPTAVEVHNDDLVIANGLQEFLPGGLTPVYPAAPHCNQRGLTELGDFLINQIIDKGMIFDPDHMSVVARDAAMTLVESRDYSGVMSSHSWSTPNALPRIYKLGGIVTPYGGGSEGFVGKWEAAKDAYRGRQYWGLGYGADMNGLGGQGGPRGLDTGNPVTYPFKSFDGSTTVDRQVSGNRTFDINTDGVAHYGLFPDWVEDLRMLAGDEIVNDLNRGAEAYLQMWERARGITKLRCPNWKGHIHPKGFGKMIPLGRKPIPVLRKAGQPVHRHRAWKWCGRGKGGANDTDTRRRKMVAVFRGRGSNAKSGFVASTLQKHETKGVHRGSREADIPSQGQARDQQPLHAQDRQGQQLRLRRQEGQGHLHRCCRPLRRQGPRRAHPLRPPRRSQQVAARRPPSAGSAEIAPYLAMLRAPHPPACSWPTDGIVAVDAQLGDSPEGDSRGHGDLRPAAGCSAGFSRQSVSGSCRQRRVGHRPKRSAARTGPS